MVSLSRKWIYLIYLVAQPALILICIYGIGPFPGEHGSGIMEIFMGASIAQFLLFFFVLPMKKHLLLTSIILGPLLSAVNIYITMEFVYDLLGQEHFNYTTFSVNYAPWIEWLSKHAPGQPSDDVILKMLFLLFTYIFSVGDTEIIYKMLKKQSSGSNTSAS